MSSIQGTVIKFPKGIFILRKRYQYERIWNIRNDSRSFVNYIFISKSILTQGVCVNIQIRGLM